MSTQTTGGLQPSGMTTIMGSTDLGSGNPSYSDASSAGPATPKVPNATTHFVGRKKKPISKEQADNKASKQDMGYVVSDQGVRCGACRFYNDKLCSLVQGNINGQDGVCAFFSHTNLTNIKPDSSDPPFTKDEAGYIEVTGGTRCGTCQFYDDKKCDIVEGDIDPAWGCCVAWKGDIGNPTKDTNTFDIKNPSMPNTEPFNIHAKDNDPTNNVNTIEKRYCRACSAGADEKTVTCSKCGSMEFTAQPISHYTLAGN